MPSTNTGAELPRAVVVCITDAPEERVRIAGQFDGVGVLVMASDADSASAFLGNLGEAAAAAGACHAQPAEDHQVLCLGELRLDLVDHEASWQGRLLDLTPHEFRVLSSLASRPGRVWTYQHLYDRAWDRPFFTGPAAVQSVVKRLRAKLRQAGVSVRIDAARGLGFRLVVAPTGSG